MSSIDKAALRWALLRSERQLDTDEQGAFDAWYASDVRHQGAYLRAMAIHNALSRATVQENLRPRGEALGLAPGLDPALPPSLHRPALRPGRRTWLALGGLAASVLIFYMPALHTPQDPAVVLETARGEFRRMPLADHSIASLNSASQIDVRLGAQARQVALRKGEAWFDVAKDKARPFIVEAGGVKVQAVGTSFGVRRLPGGAEILVTEGVVSVWTDEAAGSQSRLRAGESAFVPNGGGTIAIDRHPQEIERRLAWREGKIIFANQSLRDAVADFNRYSAKVIVIVDSKLEGKRLVGQYQIDAPERFARDVSLFLKVPLSITAKEIRIGRES